MPRFFFDIDSGDSRTLDTDGLEFADVSPACDEAISILPTVARDEFPADGRRAFTVKVRDESGDILFSATFTVTTEWQIQTPVEPERRPGCYS